MFQLQHACFPNRCSRGHSLHMYEVYMGIPSSTQEVSQSIRYAWRRARGFRTYPKHNGHETTRDKQHRNENESRRRSLSGLILFFSRCCCCHVGFTRVEPACRSTKKKACSMFVLFAKRRRSETSFSSSSGMAGWREAGFADGTPTLWSAFFWFLCTGRSCPAYVFARQNPRGPSYVSKGLPPAP